jgi:hypothetical protein
MIGFTLALFIGTAAIAAWVTTRFPKLAPDSLVVRVVTAAVSVTVLELAPVATGGTAILYLTVFALAIVLLAVWLSALWMLLGVRDLLA